MKQKKLDYFDDYFRLGEIEVAEEPDDGGVVIGDKNESSGCFIENSDE